MALTVTGDLAPADWDRAWCVASDVDPHWAGIGAPSDVIDALVADENLDAVRADPDAEQPRYR